MNVMVLTNMVPFARRGVDDLAAGLTAALRRHGAKAETMRIPVGGRSHERLVDAMALCRSLQVTNTDRVIALEFPAYLVTHRKKTLWVHAQFRDAYEAAAAVATGDPAAARRGEIHALVRRADCACFAEAERLFCSASPTQARMRQYGGTLPEILPPPIDDTELFGGGAYGDYVLANAAASPAGRQRLLIEAMREATASLRLVIAGEPETAAEAAELRRAAAGLEDRVRLDLRPLPRAELAALVNGALAVVSVPDGADTPDPVALAALPAAKPIVSVADAGALLDWVRHDESGLVVAPQPAALAAAIDWLAMAPDRPARFGRVGRALRLGRDLGWPAVVERLLS
jgi:Glycosyl transferases group 1